MSCRWEIQVDPWFHSIRLHFDGKFDIGQDKLEVSGVSDNGRIDFNNVPIGTKPTPQTLRTSRLVVTFTSFDGTPGIGFDVSWEAVCGGVLSIQKGNFSSPNYGAQYPTNQNCEWEIHGEKNYPIIHLYFEPLFELEASNDGTCDFDYVEVFDSLPNGVLASKGKFCGHISPPPLTSTFSKMVVRFHSDEDKTFKGFYASWESISYDCNIVYKTNSGEITTPHFPNNYPDNFDCRWEIQAEKGNVIKLSFQKPFSLEDNSHCIDDYVELYDVSDQGDLTTKGRWCGSDIPPVHQSSRSKLVLVFHSDDRKTSQGFHAVWNTVSEISCGEVYQTGQGFFTSPNYPYQYPENSYCRWEINPQGDTNFVLQFNPLFDVETDANCSWDYVQIIRGNDVVGQWCGKIPPQPVESHGDKIVIIFKSDKSNGGQGFFVSWKST